MAFLELLESIRNPVLDTFFLLVTRLGEEAIYMAVALGVFWCGKKADGYYLLSVGFLGVIGNQVLKLLFRVPRPFVKNPNLTAVEGAIPAATGYSFPSGHTQIATGVFGGMARITRRTYLRFLGVLLLLLVAFSRMYLGVHTPLDVAVSLLFGAALVFSLAPLFARVEKNGNLMYIISAVFIAVAFANLLFVHLYPFGEDATNENVLDGIKNAWSLFGAILGLPLIHYVDTRYTHFSGEARPFAQVMKVAVGLLLLISVKEGLKIPFYALPDGIQGPLHALRYFIVVLFGGVLYPALFRFLPTSWKEKKTSGAEL